MPVSKPIFSAVSISACAVPRCRHSAMNAASSRIFRRRRGGERMIRRQRHEFRAEQRVRPRGEDFELALAVRRGRRIEREADQQAFRAADPVLLHQPHFFRPAVERVERVEQVAAKFGDREEPLRQLALLDQRAGAPAAAVDHLLVGQHGLSTGSQFTFDCLRSTRPARRKSRNIFCWCL